MKRALSLLAGFGYMVLLIEAIRTGVGWSRGAALDHWEIMLLASLPALGWVWWRYLSPFGRDRGSCLVPEDSQR